jgi:hypothetical protein
MQKNNRHFAPDAKIIGENPMEYKTLDEELPAPTGCQRFIIYCFNKQILCACLQMIEYLPAYEIL